MILHVQNYVCIIIFNSMLSIQTFALMLDKREWPEFGDNNLTRLSELDLVTTPFVSTPIRLFLESCSRR
jgi:hypothetical protein